MKLDGKTAFVTGAARGIGEALAVGLAEHGADIVICDLDREQAALADTRSKVEARERKCFSYCLDVTVKPQIDSVVANVLNTVGAIDILVNNAGILVPKLLEELDATLWDRHFELSRMIIYHLVG